VDGSMGFVRRRKILKSRESLIKLAAYINCIYFPKRNPFLDIICLLNTNKLDLEVLIPCTKYQYLFIDFREYFFNIVS